MASVTIHLPGIPDWDAKTQRLVDAVIRAHEAAATSNNNCSNGGAVNAFHGSGSFRQAIVGGIVTLGSHHGPISRARDRFLENHERWYADWIRFGGKIEGWGNSFFKNGDPAWFEVDEILESEFPGHYETLQTKTKFLNSCKLRDCGLRPNAAMYTAIACEIAGIPTGFEELLFLLPRIPVWAMKCQQTHT